MPDDRSCVYEDRISKDLRMVEILLCKCLLGAHMLTTTSAKVTLQSEAIGKCQAYMGFNVDGRSAPGAHSLVCVFLFPDLRVSRNMWKSVRKGHGNFPLDECQGLFKGHKLSESTFLQLPELRAVAL